jgi:Isocitrate/isopropylmalate dehydrogenase
MRVVCLPGDGIGPEVTAAAQEALAALAPDLELEEHSFGGAAILESGTPLPDETLAACREADAVLLGAVGLPQLDAADVRPDRASSPCAASSTCMPTSSTASTVPSRRGSSMRPWTTRWRGWRHPTSEGLRRRPR